LSGGHCARGLFRCFDHGTVFWRSKIFSAAS
jgi:hypothetical protein